MVAEKKPNGQYRFVQKIVALDDVQNELSAAKAALWIALRLSPRGVAQPGSASGLGPEGRGFESRRPDINYPSLFRSSSVQSSSRARSSAGLEQRTSNPQAVGSSPTGRALVIRNEVLNATYTGDVAEGLGRGLQNLVRRFESARNECESFFIPSSHLQPEN